jgi:hypothetical protein
MVPWWHAEKKTIYREHGSPKSSELAKYTAGLNG